MIRGHIAVDLDGTLAHYDEWRGIEHIGDPIPAMMERVKKWIAEGETVIIFTARITPYPGEPDGARLKAIRHIHEWLLKNGLPKLEVTNIKSQFMREFWDDRAIRVEVNTGARCSTHYAE